MQPLKIIADLIKVNEASARNFCSYIQSKVQPPPSYRLIVQAVQALPPEQRNRQNVIEWIKCGQPKISNIPKNTSKIPEQLVPTITIGKKVSKQDTTATTIKPNKPSRPGSGGFIDLDESELPSPILQHDPRKHLDGFKKCPHGVVSWAKCAICDPEGFKNFVYEDD